MKVGRRFRRWRKKRCHLNCRQPGKEYVRAFLMGLVSVHNAPLTFSKLALKNSP